ncbi:MAG: class I SAM-dependent methyltransferase [Rhodocyclaceae bacterium]|nr:class I SAM-dependent methyltransferase [Rhodocyclaceae bacterium]
MFVGNAACIPDATAGSCTLCGHPSLEVYFDAGRWRILHCRRCGNAVTDPRPVNHEAVVPDFHSQFGYNTLDDVSPQWRGAVLKQIDLLTSQLAPGAAILEIGCGRGLALRELTSRGYAATGIEISPAAAAAARFNGLDVRAADFMALDDPGTYDAIFLSHVLEHVPDVGPFLDKVAAALKLSGVVVFAQTNWQGLVPRLQRRRWYGWTPDQHCWHFTPQGLATVLALHGWTVLRTEQSSLSHGNSLLSRLGPVIGLGDQFHLAAVRPVPGG